FAGVLLECLHVPPPGDEVSFARAFAALTELVERGRDEIAAVVLEPVLQGAAGMRVHDAAYLREARALCDANEVLLVFDEVFTGYGRTGPMWASELAGVSPDILCMA